MFSAVSKSGVGSEAGMMGSQELGWSRPQPAVSKKVHVYVYDCMCVYM